MEMGQRVKVLATIPDYLNFIPGTAGDQMPYKLSHDWHTSATARVCPLTYTNKIIMKETLTIPMNKSIIASTFPTHKTPHTVCQLSPPASRANPSYLEEPSQSRAGKTAQQVKVPGPSLTTDIPFEEPE